MWTYQGRVGGSLLDRGMYRYVKKQAELNVNGKI